MTYNDDNNMVTASGQSKIFASTFTAAATLGWAGQDIPGYLFNFRQSPVPVDSVGGNIEYFDRV